MSLSVVSVAWGEPIKWDTHLRFETEKSCNPLCRSRSIAESVRFSSLMIYYGCNNRAKLMLWIIKSGLGSKDRKLGEIGAE